jgi:hypothetical protein
MHRRSILRGVAASVAAAAHAQFQKAGFTVLDEAR